MDTAYNLPFQAYLIVNPNTSPQKIDFGPWTDIQYSDDQVTLLTFRPTKDRDIVEKVCERLIDEVSNAVKLADQFYIKINPNP